MLSKGLSASPPNRTDCERVITHVAGSTAIWSVLAKRMFRATPRTTSASGPTKTSSAEVENASVVVTENWRLPSLLADTPTSKPRVVSSSVSLFVDQKSAPASNSKPALIAVSTVPESERVVMAPRL